VVNRSIILNPIFHEELNTFCLSVLDERYFSVAEIWDIENLTIWKQLDNFIPSMTIDVSLSPLMTENGLSIIGADESARLRSLNHIFQRIDFLTTIGITDISISSPKDVIESFRPQAIEQLTTGLIEVCNYAIQKGIQVSFEPFDRDFHKHRLIGTTEEFVKLAKDVRNQCPNFYLIWDSAHVFLQENVLLESMEKSTDYIKRIHFANVCTDKKHPYFGDCHIPFREIGNIEIKDILPLYEITRNKSNIESVAFEVAVNESIFQVSTPISVITHIKDLFHRLETA